MDQLSTAFKWIKRNLFWIGCFLMSILMIGIWFYIGMGIDESTDSNSKKIASSISTADGISRVSAAGVEETAAHPNEKSQAGVKDEMRRTVESIIQAWQKRVDDQGKILKWPKVVVDTSPQFTEVFGRYVFDEPPELIPDEWVKGDGRLGALLDVYALKIPEQMVSLCGDDLLRTRWDFDPAHQANANSTNNTMDDEDSMGDGMGMGGGGRMGMGGMGMGGMGMGGGRMGMGGGIGGDADIEPIDMNQYAVIWDGANQQLWNTKLTQFANRDDHGGGLNRPTPLQCYMLQQDLWLLEAIFRIVREVNGDSNANDISIIKNIDHVVFGRDVGPKLGALTPVDHSLGKGVVADNGMGFGRGGGDEPGADENYEDEEDPMGSFGGRGVMGGAPGMGGGAASTVGLPPYHERYVDVNYEPLDWEKVKTIIGGAEGAGLPESDLELIISKRVPVRIAVKMKETEIATFMAACANSPFAFEIQQVRWNKHTPGEGIVLGGAGATGGMMGGGGVRGGAMGMGGVGGGAMGMGGVGGGFEGTGSSVKSTPVETRTNYDVDVEFYGIVKIYNPVRAGFLRKAAGVEDDEAGDPNDAASVTPITGNQTNP